MIDLQKNTRLFLLHCTARFQRSLTIDSRAPRRSLRLVAFASMAGVSWRPDPLWVRQSTALEGSFPSYRYSQVISCPFLGADGAGRACKEAGWPYEMVNGIDINTKLEASLKQLHGEGHEGIMIKDFGL